LSLFAYLIFIKILTIIQSLKSKNSMNSKNKFAKSKIYFQSLSVQNENMNSKFNKMQMMMCGNVQGLLLV